MGKYPQHKPRAIRSLKTVPTRHEEGHMTTPTIKGAKVMVYISAFTVKCRKKGTYNVGIGNVK